MAPRKSVPTNTGRLTRPQGEVSTRTLANPGLQGGGTLSGGHDVDVVIARATQTIQDKAEELGLELEGRISVQRKSSAYVVRQGRAIMGRLTQDQLVRQDVDHLFLLSRSVWLDVVAPPKDISWAEWSSPLFAVQWALGKLMDAALDELRLAVRSGSAPMAFVQPGEDPAEVPLATLAYRVIAFEPEQNKLRAEAVKLATRLKSRHWAARSKFSISGSTASCAGQTVMTFFNRWQKGEIGYPSWSGPKSSIPLRGDDLTLWQDDDKRLNFSFSVQAGRGTKHTCFVSPKGGSAWSQVRKILSKEFEPGAARLVWHEGKRRWRISISYKMPRLKPKGNSTGFLVVRRNVADVLYVMNSEGRSFADCQGIGLKLIHQRGHFLRRKRDVKKTLNHQGRGARGHGKKRFFRLYSKLEDAEVRTVDTILKQFASAIRRAAELSNATVVFMEDCSLPWTPMGISDEGFLKILKRMPWSKLEGLLRVELEEHGIKLKKISQAHDATHCPVCAENALEEDRKGYMKCKACDLLVFRPAAAATNMFVAAGVDTNGLKTHLRMVSSNLHRIRRGEEPETLAAAE